VLIFAPAIYEHAAKIINASPSVVCQDPVSLAKAHIEAYRLYGHPIVIPAIDIYNVEAEAMGVKVQYFSNASMPVAREGCWRLPVEVDRLPNPNEFPRGRMIINLRAAKLVVRELGEEPCEISFPISGPLSIAAKLLGSAELLMAVATNVKALDQLLNWIAAVLLRYIEAIVDLGVSITIFESMAAPPLISPLFFAEHLEPHLMKLMNRTEILSKRRPALIIGGNTIDLLPAYARLRPSLFICDYLPHLPNFVGLSRNYHLSLRVNITKELVQQLRSVKTIAGDLPVMISTGIVPYNAKPEEVLALKELIARVNGE